jgi:hypothetical protein
MVRGGKQLNNSAQVRCATIAACLQMAAPLPGGERPETAPVHDLRRGAP